MNSWYLRATWGVGVLAALLLALPMHLASADEPVKIRVEVNDSGFNPEAIEVEQGQVVELTFVWAHVGYIQEEHIMVLEGYKLESDKINAQNKEATLQFIADKPGTFTFKCDLDCEVHDYLQKGNLKVKRTGGAPPPAQQGEETSATAGTAPSGQSQGASGGAPPAPAGPMLLSTTLTLSPSTWTTAGEPITLMAALQDSRGNPVSKAEIRFFQDTSFAGTKAEMEIGVAKTDANGVAFLEFRPTMADRQQTITATFAGRGLHAESQEAIQLTEAGIPPPAYTTAPIGLEPLRRWAPLALAGIILGGWITFGFVMYQAFGVAWARARR